MQIGARDEVSWLLFNSGGLCRERIGQERNWIEGFFISFSHLVVGSSLVPVSSSELSSEALRSKDRFNKWTVPSGWALSNSRTAAAIRNENHWLDWTVALQFRCYLDFSLGHSRYPCASEPNHCPICTSVRLEPIRPTWNVRVREYQWNITETLPLVPTDIMNEVLHVLMFG